LIVPLAISWSVSRGRETYGYPIVRLDDWDTGKRYRAMGGGYDMVGTVFGEWLADTHADALLGIAGRAYTVVTGYGRSKSDHPDPLYGMRVLCDSHARPARVALDGACGLDAMVAIAEAIGLRVRRHVNAKGNLTGLTVTDEA
jgi:hypothetical protein